LTTKIKILIVDDEKDIVDILKYNIEKEYNYVVSTAYNGRDALKISNIEKPELIILDIMMPGMNGYDVCKSLKSDISTKNIPIIFLTAKENEIDEILGLELGADDYIQKPVSPRVVLARINSVLRRTKKGASEDTNDVIVFKGIEINSENYSVKINKREIFFPKKEFQLLKFFLTNRGKVFPREQLLKQVWGENIFVVDRTVDVHLVRIREKLGEYANHIETIKGFGYRFRE
jgi:two-component system, OmpR family, alkaline phosphatase synthesis response regulator PhoP